MLFISEDLRDALASAATGLIGAAPNNADELAHVRQAAASCRQLLDLAQAVNSIVDEQGFVQIAELPVAHVQPLFLGLVTLLGAVFIDPSEGSAVISAHVRPQQHLMGNQVRALPLHTDYSMMANPPRLTMSLCVCADRVRGFGSLNVADVEAMCFGLDGDDDVARFKTVKLPFAARSIGNEVEVIDSPIITTESDGRFIVRYHRSRIVQGFRHRQQFATREQLMAMRGFEEWVRDNEQTMPVEAGYLTVLDNHRMVHGRERCSVELSLDGTAQGRQMLFVFAH